MSKKQAITIKTSQNGRYVREAYVAESIGEFISILQNDVEYDLQEMTAHPRAIFRGQANAEWALIPKLLRQSPQGMSKSNYNWYISEDFIMDKFIRNARMLISSPPESYIDWIAYAQHHGQPTRLLDFTTKALVALFFAVNENISHGVEYSIVWVIQR